MLLKTFLPQLIDEIIKWIKKWWFETKLTARLNQLEAEAKAQYNKELKYFYTPEFTEHKINTQIQTGESQKLGGMMQLSAKWHKNKDKSTGNSN